MRVLITGSAGFIGSHVVDHFLANTDWDIIGIDSFRHRGDSLRVQSDPRYKVYCHDLNSPVGLRLKMKIGEADIILNLASDSHVDRSIEDPIPFAQNNVNVAIHMLEMARTLRPRQFYQFSTDEVYGPAPLGTNYKEWATIVPSNVYSASKAAQEAFAISYWRSYGINLIITNTMNVYNYKQDPEKFITKCISKIEHGEEVPIHGDANYIGSRFYINAKDVAGALIFLIRNLEPSRYHDSTELVLPSRFNIVGNDELNNLELAQMIARLMGKPLKYKLVSFHNSRPGHDRRYALDGSLLSKLGWRPQISIEEGLKETIGNTLANPEWMI